MPEHAGRVAAAGAELVGRKLGRAGVKALARDGATLRLSLRDLTFPRATLQLHDEAVARDWQERLAPLLRN